jgi:primosomal protein N' (replication factor Y)
MELRRRVADVALDARVAGSEALYTYEAPEGAALGQGWFVPLGPRRALGWVLRVREATEEELGFPFAKLKPLLQRVEGLELPSPVVDLIWHTAGHCLASPSSIVSLASPPGINDRLVAAWKLAKEPPPEPPLSAAQSEAVSVLRQGPLYETKAKPIPKGAKNALRALQIKGIAEATLSVNPLSSRRSTAGLYRLTSNESKVEAFLDKEGRRKPAQAMTIMKLQGSSAASFSSQELKTWGGITDATIKALVQAGLLEPALEGAAPSRPAPSPNRWQAEAIHHIGGAVSERSPRGFLLYGVTGSGKTEVYLQSAAEALRWGRQVLYLVPEIALTAQVIAQLRERFGRSVAILHSNMTPPERLESWMRVQTGEAPLVLGPRSALFAPFSNLGLIVMDEEHEASYKQENTPRYHSRQVVRSLAHLHSCPWVQGSATPSLESRWEAEEGILTLLTLPQRAASARLPHVHLEDLRAGYRSGSPSLFSQPLTQAIADTFAARHQTILFLNRRAYAPFLVCRECGHKWGCPQCAVSLSYHQAEKKLKCHHCDHQEPSPLSCPQCGGVKIKSFGVGVEKVEEEAARLFPGIRAARLDRDVAKRKGALEETFARFRGGELDLLVGTQMVAKGLDFPNVALVGVIAADISLNLPDFRASERTFQLLSQVAGRAGRGVIEGKVIIQTLSPDHPSLVAAASHDYDAFYRGLIGERRDANYPPFCRLVNLLISDADREAVGSVALILARRLGQALPDGVILGPADCPIEKVQGVWRKHILVKLPRDASLLPIQEVVKSLRAEASVRVAIDVDPMSLA